MYKWGFMTVNWGTNAEQIDVITIKSVKRFVARDIFTKYHYLHYLPKHQPLRSYGFFKDGDLIGAFIIKQPHGNLTIIERGRRLRIADLARFWLKNNEHNLASRCLGMAIRFIESQGYEYIISYACSCAHQGTIYKATNFNLDGETTIGFDRRKGQTNLHWDHIKYKFTMRLKFRSGIVKSNPKQRLLGELNGQGDKREFQTVAGATDEAGAVHPQVRPEIGKGAIILNRGADATS